MSELTAIDILVNPDETAPEQADAWNARMRESIPEGSRSTRPTSHITILQR